MALISPFKATHYHLDSPDLSDVVIPPYDVLSDKEADAFRKKSPYNFSHVDLASKADDDYQHSKDTLSQWKSKGILKETQEPCFYIYQQEFETYGKTHQRQTLVCTVGLEDFSKKVVRPHENTFGKYKADRLQLARQTGFNLSHIFGMVKDEDGFLASFFEQHTYHPPFLTAASTYDNVKHSVWKIPAAAQVTDFFKDQPVYIVDGHHRYESALMLARELGVEGKWDNPAAHTTFCIANVFDPALVVLPTHRVISKGSSSPSLSDLSHQFDLLSMPEEDFKALTRNSNALPVFGLYYRGELFLCRPKNWQAHEKSLGASVAKLAVTWSDHFLLKDYFGVNDSNRRDRVTYVKDFESAWNQKDGAEAVIFHAPPSVTDVTAVADEGRFMPQKSTFFIPKLAGGLLMRKMF